MTQTLQVFDGVSSDEDCNSDASEDEEADEAEEAEEAEEPGDEEKENKEEEEEVEENATQNQVAPRRPSSFNR